MYNRFTESDMLHGSQLHTVAKKWNREREKRVQTCNFGEHTVPFFRQYTFNGGICVWHIADFSLYHRATPIFAPIQLSAIDNVLLCSFDSIILAFPFSRPIPGTAAAADVIVAVISFCFLFLLLLLIRSCYVSIVSASFVQFHTYTAVYLWTSTHCIHTNTPCT